jgi:hypothetical protein
MFPVPAGQSGLMSELSPKPVLRDLLILRVAECPLPGIPDVKCLKLLGKNVLKAVIPGAGSGRRVPPDLSHSQEIEERGLCPELGH